MIWRLQDLDFMSCSDITIGGGLSVNELISIHSMITLLLLISGDRESKIYPRNTELEV